MSVFPGDLITSHFIRKNEQVRGIKKEGEVGYMFIGEIVYFLVAFSHNHP